MKRLSVVLPCYNEAGNLSEILARYRPLTAGLPLELVLVDNGSTDDSPAIFRTLLAREENRFAVLVRVPKNRGYGFGLQRGLEAATGDVLAISHADLQCRPEDLRRAAALYEEASATHPALVKGRRQGFRPAADRLVTRFYNALTRLALGLTVQAQHSQADPHARTIDVNAEPKLFPAALKAALLEGPPDFTFDLYLLFRAARDGLDIIEFDVTYEARRWGKSKLAANPWVRVKTSINAFWKLLEMALGKRRFSVSG